MLQVAAQELGVPVEMCHTSENTSAAIVNASPTAASTGSDLNGMAVKDACEQLTKRLKPYREKVGPSAPFAAVVKAAYFDRCRPSLFSLRLRACLKSKPSQTSLQLGSTRPPT